MGFKKSNLVPPPAPNSIFDCFGVPVAKGQRRHGIQEIKFGALQHQIRFRNVLACQLTKDSGVVEFQKSTLVLSSTKFEFGLFWRASC